MLDELSIGEQLRLHQMRHFGERFLIAGEIFLGASAGLCSHVGKNDNKETVVMKTGRQKRKRPLSSIENGEMFGLPRVGRHE